MIVMRAPDKIMTCAEFQDALPELFESQADLGGHEHLKTCENCAALVRDLSTSPPRPACFCPSMTPARLFGKTSSRRFARVAPVVPQLQRLANSGSHPRLASYNQNP